MKLYVKRCSMDSLVRYRYHIGYMSIREKSDIYNDIPKRITGRTPATSACNILHKVGHFGRRNILLRPMSLNKLPSMDLSSAPSVIFHVSAP